MSFAIHKYLDAGYPVLYVRTGEQERALQELLANLRSSGLADKLTVMLWKSTVGLYNLNEQDPANKRVAHDINETLNYIGGQLGETRADNLYVMFNVRDFLKSPLIIQLFRDTAYKLRTVGSHIVIIGGAYEVPEELEDVITFVDLELPTKEEIRSIFQSTVDRYREHLKTDPDELKVALDQAAENALGLTAFKAENAIGLSIVSSMRVDIPLIRTEKQLAVKQSGVLEYLHHSEDIDTLGGFEVLKEHVKKRRKYFRNHAAALAFGLRPPKGLMLVGIAGCVSGDTEVLYRRGNRAAGRPIRLEDFYKKFNRLPASTRPWVKECDTYLPSHDYETGRIIYNKVLGVYEMGTKRCITISTDIAGDVTLTPDHPVLCGDGIFRRADEIGVSDDLLVKGSMRALGGAVPARDASTRKRVVVEALRYHPTGWRKAVTEYDRSDPFDSGKTYEYVRQHRARLVVEAHMNAMPLFEFIHVLKTDEARAKTFTYLPKEAEVHHIDEDPRNDVLNNLMVMTKSEHTAHHCGEERFNKEYVRTAKVTSIVEAGERTVYDVSMLAPACNFVVNAGIIVHNTGKTLTAKAVSSLLDLPLYKFDVGAVFKGIVGGSEAAIRNALKLAETVAPCVLLIDEMEKLVAGLESSGKTDSGVTSRVIGTLISWMQETTSPIYKLATCNTIRNLDSALFRRGRWDAVFAVDLPTSDERKEIFSIHLKKRNRAPEDFNLDILAKATENFVGAEIESVVDEALYLAFDDDERAVRTEDLVTVAKTVVPISKTDEEAIAAFRGWMQDRAQPVSKAKTPEKWSGKGPRNLRVTV